MSNYKWNYSRVGGETHVNIANGEDIAHLGELDKKQWAALACPVKFLDMDPRTLAILDRDGDGIISADNVIGGAEWLTSMLRNKDLILEGRSEIELSEFNDTERGKRMRRSAECILTYLKKKKKTTLSIEDCSDSKAIFCGTRFNGDGIVTAITTEGNKDLDDILKAIIDVEGPLEDRSGEPGVNKENIDKFFAACTDYRDWRESAFADKSILPYGEEGTAAAFAAVEELKEKVEDFFMRCKLVAFDANCSAAVDIDAAKVAEVAANNLSACAGEIAQYPLARPNAEGKLQLGAINPAWSERFAALKKAVLDKEFAKTKSIDEEQWRAVLAKLAPYATWKSQAKGLEVEALGLDFVKKILASDAQSELLELVEKDEEFREQAVNIDKVINMLFFYRDFNKFLHNFVVFSEFYDRKDGNRAIFEAGRLFIDKRCCELCVKVADMGAHADMAGLSEMYLIYCKCYSADSSETFNVVAALTDGNVGSLRVGMNAVFYDREGREWNAVVTKLVDNPISIKQAFWAPYIKFWNFCIGLLNKSAAAKDSKIAQDLEKTAQDTQAKVESGEKPAAAPQPFDIAKFAGIFAAIGMAIGYIGSFLTDVAKGINSVPAWQLPVYVACLMLVISAPSCFLAWGKLRKRNVGPILNANGWAINSGALVNVTFGTMLTSIAKFPIVKIADPYAAKKWSAWKVCLLILVILAAVAVAAYFTGCFGLWVAK